MDPRVVELQRDAAVRGGVIDLAGGLPADELLPRQQLTRALGEITIPKRALQYGWPEGDGELRAWIARRLAARGATVDPDRIIVTAGAQQALGIAAAIAGGTIAVGDATYHAALDAFARAGARVVADAPGATRYAIAGVSNPHGVALPAPPPDAPAIVDEAYVELRFDGHVPAPIVGVRAWLVGTVSKTLAPGLRVGWLVPPAAHHADALDRKQAADLQTASLSQAALARLLALLDYDDHVARARANYAARADRFVAALRRHVDGIRFTTPEGGFSVWIETDDVGDELALVREAFACGVMFDPGGAFCPAPRATVALRASYSNVPPAALDEGARRLGLALTRWRTMLRWRGTSACSSTPA